MLIAWWWDYKIYQKRLLLFWKHRLISLLFFLQQKIIEYVSLKTLNNHNFLKNVLQ